MKTFEIYFRLGMYILLAFLLIPLLIITYIPSFTYMFILFIYVGLFICVLIDPIKWIIKNKRVNKYIVERNNDLLGNIALYSVGQEILLKDKRTIKILDKTINSLLVYIPKTNKKDNQGNYTGINSTQWMYIKEFEDRFKKNFNI